MQMPTKEVLKRRKSNETFLNFSKKIPLKIYGDLMQDVEILFRIFFVDRSEQPSERLTGLCLMKCSSKMLQNLFGI